MISDATTKNFRGGGRGLQPLNRPGYATGHKQNKYNMLQKL